MLLRRANGPTNSQELVNRKKTAALHGGAAGVVVLLR